MEKYLSTLRLFQHVLLGGLHMAVLAIATDTFPLVCLGILQEVTVNPFLPLEKLETLHQLWTGTLIHFFPQ